MANPNSLILTVNSSTGTDTPSGSRPASLTNGDYSAHPFATIQAALDASAKSSDNKITVSAGTYDGFLAQGFTGDIEVLGTLAAVTPTTGVASGTAGTGTSQTAIKKPTAAANWAVGELRGALVVITGGGGYYADTYVPFFGPCARRIVDNTADTLVIDQWIFGTLGTTTTFEIVRPATLLNDYTSTYQAVTFCAGAANNSNRTCFRNFKMNDLSPMYGVLAQGCSKFEFHSMDFPQRANGTSHISALENHFVYGACNDFLGDGTEQAYFSRLHALSLGSQTIGNVQFYMREIETVSVQADIKAAGHRVIRPSWCNHVVLDVNANACTATVVYCRAIDHLETTRLSGSNPSIGASGPSVWVDDGGKYDFTGATITGPTTNTLQVGSDTLLSWATITASSYVKGSMEIVASTAQNPAVPARVMPKLNTDTNVDNAVAAAGTNQATATALTKPINYVTTGNQSTPNGVRLPSANTADVPFYVFNVISAPVTAGSVGINVYPATGESIEPNAANARDFLYPGQGAMYIPLGGGKWRAVTLTIKSDATSYLHPGTQWFYNGVRFLYTVGFESYNPAGAANFDLLGSNATSLRIRDGGSATNMMTFDTSNDTIIAEFPFQERRRVSSLTSNTTLVALDGGRTYNNTGAAGAVVVTLPTPVAGMVFRFRVTAAQSLQLKPASGHTIQFDATSVASSQDIRSATIGTLIEVEAQSSTAWFVTNTRGTWTVV
jgi:hypothetical protein